MRRLALVVIVAAGCSRGVEVGPVEDATVVADADAFAESDVATEGDAETGTDAEAEVGGDAATDADAETETEADADADAETGADAAPEPTLLGSVARPRDIAVGGGYAFVTSFDGAIFRLPTSGGTATKIASPEWPTYVGVDSTHVYWTDLAIAPNPGSVGRVPIGGGTSEILAAGLVGPNSCTLFGGRVYFAHGTTSGRIESVPVSGGVVATIATGVNQPYYAAANSTRVCWATNGNSIECSAGGTLVSGEPSRIQFVALDETHAYYALGSGVLRRVALTGGAPVTVDTGPATLFAMEIILDGENVYWFSAGQIRRVAKSTFSALPIHAGADGVQGFAVDATHVYWTSSADTQIRKLPK